MKKPALCLLLIGACASPNTSDPGGVSGLHAGGQTKVTTTPTNYVEWLDTLPMVEGEASKPFQADFHGKLVFNVLSEDIALDIQMSGRIEYADLRHFRERIDLRLDLGAIDASIPDVPVNLTILISADGEKLYVEPILEESWLLEMLRQSPAAGFESQAFTLDLDLFEQMFEVYWTFLEESDIDMDTILPEGVTMEEFFAQGLNPAAWARLYLMTADIETFRIDSSEVHVTAKLRDNWMTGVVAMEDPQAASMMEDFEYEMVFDRRTGIPTSMGMTMHIEEEVQMEMVIDFKQFLIGDNIFAPNHFQRSQLMQRTEFPMDIFVQMALSAMQGQMHEDDEDIPF